VLTVQKLYKQVNSSLIKGALIKQAAKRIFQLLLSPYSRQRKERIILSSMEGIFSWEKFEKTIQKKLS